MKNNIMKPICLGLLGSFSLFLIISCSGMKNYLSWAKFSKTEEKKEVPKKKDVPQRAPRCAPPRGNPDSHYLLACQYLERERLKEALGEFKKVLSIDPNYVKAYNGLGVSYDLLRDFPRAIESYQHALRLNPDLVTVLNNLGFSYLLQEDPDQAIPLFKKAIALNDRDERFHNNLGMAYAMKGNLDLAMAEFKVASGEAKAHYNLAQFLYKKKSYDAAKVHFTAALDLDPSLTHVYTALQATDALSSIFRNDTEKTEAKLPEVPEQSAEKKVEERTAEPSDHRDQGNRAEIKTATLNRIPVLTREPKPKETTPSQLGAGAAGSYELQIASFHSIEKAASARSTFRGSGYRTLIREWEDEKGDKWYRLFIGPYTAKDEAVASKARIEKEFQLVPMIVQPAATPAKSVEVASKEQPQETKSLSFLNGAAIEISNGNGVSRMAKKVGYYLRERGAKVIRFTNADHYNHNDTKIYYQKDSSEAADYVADQLPVARNTEETKKLDWPNLKIKVVIGKDLIQHKTVFEEHRPESRVDIRADNRP